VDCVSEARTSMISRLIARGFSLSAGIWILTGFFRSKMPGTAFYLLHSFADWLFLICGLGLAVLFFRDRLFGDRELSLKNIDRNTLTAVVPMLLGGILLFGGLEIYGRQSVLTKEALADANRSPTATEVLGSPIRAGWVTSMSIRGVDDGIEGRESIRVKGSMGSGELHVSGIQHRGEWQVTSLSVLCDKCQTETEIAH